MAGSKKNLFLENEDIMTPLQWELATAGVRITKKNLEIMRRILVDGQAPGDVAKNAGVGRDKISKWRARIISNYQAILEQNNLVCREVVLTKKDDKELSKKEKALVRQILNETKSRTKE